VESDVLYVVRPGERNESLRLSLRSLANLPHRRVFIAGYCPAWVQGVTHIHVRQGSDKFANIQRNVAAAVSNPELGQEIVYMNDDFYITRPVDRVPVTHGGPVGEYKGRNDLRLRMRNTVEALRLEVSGDLLTYDGTHMPLPIDRDRVRLALSIAPPKRILWRTWYGNLAGIGGERVQDAKHRGPAPIDELPLFFSTNAGGLQVTRELLEEVLPRDCPYLAS
jgi:hypothetical protein